MNKTFIALAAAGLLSAVPAIVSAQAVSASLSASFGENGASDIFAPNSVSVSAAAGVIAVSTGASNAVSSATSAGATSDNEFTPVANIDLNGGSYETSITFQEVIDVDALITAALAEYDEDIQAQLTALEATLGASIAEICEAGFDVDFDLATIPFRTAQGILGAQGEVRTTTFAFGPELTAVAVDDETGMINVTCAA